MRKLLTHIGVLTARPGAFLIVLVYAVLWCVLSPETLHWHGIATMCTWMMTLVIQRAEHRDTQALQAKLDELLRVHDAASDKLTNIDRKEPEEIEEQREEATVMPSFHN